MFSNIFITFLAVWQVSNINSVANAIMCTGPLTANLFYLYFILLLNKLPLVV
jgi:hypothetical protein